MTEEPHPTIAALRYLIDSTNEEIKKQEAALVSNIQKFNDMDAEALRKIKASQAEVDAIRDRITANKKIPRRPGVSIKSIDERLQAYEKELPSKSSAHDEAQKK